MSFYKDTGNKSVIEATKRVYGPGFALDIDDAEKPTHANAVDGWFWADSKIDALTAIGVTSLTATITVSDLELVSRFFADRKRWNVENPDNTFTAIEFLLKLITYSLNKLEDRFGDLT